MTHEGGKEREGLTKGISLGGVERVGSQSTEAGPEALASGA